ncbi:MAG: PDGLE domain-containing protein [Candidatus Bathyarchaeia archaeon]
MKGYVKAVILILFGLALLIPFASTFPDGLETVAEHFGVEEPEPVWVGLMPDYALPWIGNVYVATLASGVIGVFLVLVASWFVGRAVTHKG